MIANLRWSFILIGLIGPPLMGEAPRMTLVVKGNGMAMGETPVIVPVEASIEPGNYNLAGGTDTLRIANVFREGGKTYLATVLPSVPASGEYVTPLAPNLPNNVGGIGFKSNPSGTTLDVLLGGEPFTTYQAPPAFKPYLFPLIGPTGKPFTRAFPMVDVPGEKRDHPHQRSLWFTHGKVNGVDFWAELKGHGSIRETSRTVENRGVVGVLRTTDDWVGPDGKLVCADERTIRFYRTAGARVLDFEITIKATNGPVSFGDTKEGMFGVRVASSMDVDAKKGGKITNAEGLTDAAAWGKASPWVDYSGPVEGETVGIAILNHPTSFRFPTTWHVRTYGLFAANPFGYHDFGMKQSGDHAIPAGESIRFAYRVILHKGDTASAGLPAAFSAYATPPTVEVKVD